jgi:YVTN family beta-propeller protein
MSRTKLRHGVVDRRGKHTVTATIPIGDNPVGVAINPDGSVVYVIHYPTNSGTDTGIVSVIDAATNAIRATIAVGVPGGVAVSLNGSTVYVTNYLSDTVSMIDSTTTMVRATIPVGGGPLGIAVRPDSGAVYVADCAAIFICSPIQRRRKSSCRPPWDWGHRCSNAAGGARCGGLFAPDGRGSRQDGGWRSFGVVCKVITGRCGKGLCNEFFRATKI